MNPNGNAGSNPPAGGSGGQTPATNPPVGGSPTTTQVTNPQVGGSPNQTPATPTGHPAADGKSANSPAEGRSPAGTTDDTVTAEIKRENQSLRKRLEALEQERQAAEDAKLSVDERRDKELARLQREASDYAIEKQQWALERAVIEEAQTRRLHSVAHTVRMLQSEFGDQLDFDDSTGKPTNVTKMLDRLIQKNPWIVAPEPAPNAQQPNSGRVGTTPRASAQRPQYNAEVAPVTPDQWPTLSQIQWSQPRDDLGEGGGGSGKNQ